MSRHGEKEFFKQWVYGFAPETAVIDPKKTGSSIQSAKKAKKQEESDADLYNRMVSAWSNGFGWLIGSRFSNAEESARQQKRYAASLFYLILKTRLT